MAATTPFGSLIFDPAQLRQFATLAPLATISPVSATVQSTPPLAGPMPESELVEAHVRFCVEHTGTVAVQAADGISALIDGALSAATLFESADQSNAAGQRQLAIQLPLATDPGAAAQA